MLKSSEARTLLINEAYIKYCDDPENFSRLKSHITKMSFSELKELNKKYNLSRRNQVLNESVMGVLAGLMGFIYYTPLWVAYRSLKAMDSKCSRKCNPIALNTDKRQLCLLRCKLVQYQKGLALAKQAESKCGESQNPTKCFRKAKNAEKKLADMIINIKLKMSKVEAQMI